MNLTEFSLGMKITHVDIKSVMVNPELTSTFRIWLKEFMDRMLLGDSLYYYCSEPEHWENGMGSEGYLIVRNDVIIDNLLWRMNLSVLSTPIEMRGGIAEHQEGGVLPAAVQFLIFP